jgi:hypothetical protein
MKMAHHWVLHHHFKQEVAHAITQINPHYHLMDPTAKLKSYFELFVEK